MAASPEIIALKHDVAEVRIEIYGDPARQAVGLKSRIEKLERLLTNTRLILIGLVLNIILSAVGPLPWADVAAALLSLL